MSPSQPPGEAQPCLETERLLLKPLTLEDAPAIQALFPQWDVVAFLNPRIPWPYPEDGALTHLRDVALPAMQAGRMWNWSIRLQTEPERLVGCIGLYAGEENNRGFWIDPAWWNRGIATEACGAVTAFWFDTLGAAVLRVPKAVANIGSRRISEKTGMRVIRRETRDYVSGSHSSEVWEITADEWRARRDRPCWGSIGSVGIAIANPTR